MIKKNIFYIRCSSLHKKFYLDDNFQFSVFLKTCLLFPLVYLKYLKERRPAIPTDLAIEKVCPRINYANLRGRTLFQGNLVTSGRILYLRCTLGTRR